MSLYEYCFQEDEMLSSNVAIESHRCPYLYNVKNFLPYLMWDVTNTPMQTQRPRCVSLDYGAKRINTFYEAKHNGPPHRSQRSALIPFVTTQPNHVDIVRFMAQRVFTILKNVY